MVEQTAILRVLCDSAEPVTIDDLVAAVKARGPLARKAVINRLAKLMQAGWAQRGDTRAHGINCAPSLPSYRATKEGRAFIAAGGVVKSGPRGPMTGTWRAKDQPKYAKLWSALRMQPMKRATLQQLIEITNLAIELKDADRQARAYFKALVKAGLVIRMRDRERGFAPTSNGFHRYAILKDIGPLAPLMRRDGLLNPNANNEIIAFAAREAA